MSAVAAAQDAIKLWSGQAEWTANGSVRVQCKGCCNELLYLLV